MCENMVRIIVKHTLIMIQIYLGEEIMMRSFLPLNRRMFFSSSKQATIEATMMMMLIMSRDENIFFFFIKNSFLGPPKNSR